MFQILLIEFYQILVSLYS